MSHWAELSQVLRNYLGLTGDEKDAQLITGAISVEVIYIYNII